MILLLRVTTDIPITFLVEWSLIMLLSDIVMVSMLQETLTIWRIWRAWRPAHLSLASVNQGNPNHYSLAVLIKLNIAFMKRIVSRDERFLRSLFVENIACFYKMKLFRKLPLTYTLYNNVRQEESVLRIRIRLFTSMGLDPVFFSIWYKSSTRLQGYPTRLHWEPPGLQGEPQGSIVSLHSSRKAFMAPFVSLHSPRFSLGDIAADPRRVGADPDPTV